MPVSSMYDHSSDTAVADGDRLSTLVLLAAERHGDRVALRIRQGNALREYSYHQMARHIRESANALRAAGIRPGDRVVLLSDNSPAWPIAYLALSDARATVVPLDPGLPAATLTRLFEASSPRLLVVSPEVRARLEDTSRWPVLDLHDLVRADCSVAQLADAPSDPDADETIASIIFTSGTSGQPKGVMLTHAGLVYAGRDCAAPLWELTDHDEMLLVLPLHHVYGFAAGLIGGLVAGASITFVEAIRGDVLLAAMNETHTTILPAIPRLLELLHQQIQRQVKAKGPVVETAFSAMGRITGTMKRRIGVNPGPVLFKTVFDKFGGHLRRLVSAGAPLSMDVLNGMQNLGFAVLEGYGLSETSAAATGCTFAQARPGAVGMPLAGMEIRINHPDSSGEGELCIRGKGLMRGYFRDPKLTAERIRDGWFHTGDLGVIDSHGYVTIKGRLDELIVTPAGKKASPFDVECNYRGINGIKELAVVGMRCPSGVGDEVHAAIVIEDALAQDTAAANALQADIEADISARSPNVASHLRIQKVHFVSAIPKTTKMSVKHKELRRQLEGTAQAARVEAVEESSASEPTVAKVIGLVSDIAQAKQRGIPVREHSTLQFDLGIDSLGKAELAALVEKEFGIRLEVELTSINRVSDLVRAVRDARPDGAPGSALAQRSLTPPSVRGPLSMTIARGIGLAIHAIWNVRGIGTENLPEGPYLLCPNHSTYLDGIWTAAVMPHPRREQMCSFGKRELWDHRVTKLLVTKLAKAIPVDRDGDVQPALRAGIEVLESGRPLLVHPEGTRSKNGELGQFRRGAANMALATGVPLVPVRLVGSYEVYPPHRRFPRMLPDRRLRRPALVVRFGQPIYPQAGESAGELTDRLKSAVQQLGIDIACGRDGPPRSAVLLSSVPSSRGLGSKVTD